tara:strand:- start:7541 stop:7888 length:348 start_codon:yes stop_codon:yes gene_type:complete
MKQADCGVFPSRAEGWNLELLEMMSIGKEVIATNYSGHTEFINKDNCRLIEVKELEEAHDGKWFNGQGDWGVIDLDILTKNLLEVHSNKKFNKEGVETAKMYSWSNTVKKIVSNL